MSIREKANSHGNTVTSGNRALELFTNRDEFTCLFARYLNEDPAPEKILFFHGAGGNGKTLLLEYLRKNYCKRFRRDIWQEISKQMGQSEAEAAETIANTIDNQLIKPIPAIIHDFGLPPIGNNRPQDPLYGLLMLRRNLAREAKKCGYQLKFPLFDFACFWYFRSVGKSNEEIKHLFTSDELDFVTQLIDGIAGIPWVSLAKTSVQILTKYIGVEEKLQHRGIDERKVAAIQDMDAERELIFYLPEFLAEDLNAAMAEAKREFTEAIAAYDRALTLAPDDIEVLNNKGLALISLGNLYDELSEEKAAIKCWQAALDSFSHSLKIAPSDRYIQNLRDELLVFLNDNP